ncbi:MAG: beta-lactamase family protein [Flavobacteriales bacterium]|nr:beta-lactamase family protein [Flavobacteriales bacterium]
MLFKKNGNDKQQATSTSITPLLHPLVALLNSCSVQQFEFNETGEKETLVETLDFYLDANIPPTAPGMAILVVQDGIVKYAGARGITNINTEQNIDSDSGFRLASVSKSFTALAIMQLYEKGLLSLDDSIRDYIPELSDTWQKITIHHLLTHQSGISDWRADLHLDTAIKGATDATLVDYFKTHTELEFIPGEGEDYSNSGYTFLAEIVGRISGLGFSKYMHKQIFEPLHMTNSYIADKQAIAKPNTALNYAKFKLSTLEGVAFYITGSNAMVSSLNDLHLIINGILDNALIKEETMSLMLQHYSPNIEVMGGNHYGYGWILPPSEDTNAFMHTGGHDGFSTLFLINRARKFSIVILGNGGEKTGNHSYLLELIGKFL